ncbi:hypothetical protein K8Z49_41555 [Actinomadura madurae]|uniref:DUF6879 family protein n=1 Tax=Actinomadura madurae TaxID=1993 RepID=UPI00399A9A06
MGPTPISREDFRALFRSSSRAFHLELRDSYGVDDENGPFRAWLNGEPDDYQWRTSWLDHVREVTSSGVSVQRLRVVSEPHTDYVRWEIAMDPANIEAGEDVRYFPRHLAKDIEFPDEDCWLFDDDTLVLSLFQPDGRSGGFALSDDLNLLETYRRVREAAWPRAIPSAHYTV